MEERTMTNERMKEIQAALEAAGDGWPAVANELPELLAVVEESHQTWDLVITDRAHEQWESEIVFYRRRNGSETWWGRTGWSNESRRRPFKMPGEDLTAFVEGFRMHEKLIGLSAMFEAATSNPDLDASFPADVHRYLHGKVGDDEE